MQQAPWSVIETFDDVDDMSSAWDLLMKSLIEQHFPLRRKRIQKQTHPWLNGEVLRLMRARDQVHKKAVKSGLTCDWKEYKHLRNRVTSANRKARRNYFSNKLNENRSNPRAFWNILCSVLPSKSNRSVINKLVVNDKELTNKKDIANSLNEYFTTIASTLLGNRPSSDTELYPIEQPIINPTSTFKFQSLCEADVFYALQTMDSFKATGADNIPAKVLKIAAPYISKVVTNIFNASYMSGKFPSIWKVAKVTPLYKGGLKTERDNHRPISVLPCISKIQESFANSNLQAFAQNLGLISQHQYAYVKHSSTTVALIRAVDDWKLAIDKGEKVVCAFLDLRKAFDVIDHDILLHKLKQHGVKDNELEWFRSYLSSRRQFVVSGGVESDNRNITHGVSQGSVLGPTLFNIHIDGILNACQKSKGSLYADDTELYATSKDINIAEQCVNEDLKHIDSWKTEVMVIGSRYSVANARDLHVKLNGEILKQSDHFRYLGVDIDSCLKWKKHVSNLSARMYPKLKILNRISAFLGCKTLLRIYKQTILPALDYGCMVWAECGKGNSQRLERLQNQAMRIILSANRKTCTQVMRTKLGLLSLNSRRRFLRLQLVYKIIHNIDCPQQLIGYFSRRSETHNRSLRDTTLLCVISTKSKMVESSFQCSAAKEWNALPKHLRDLKTLSSFKNNFFKFFLETDAHEHRCSI